jgi:hypothetical protein
LPERGSRTLPRVFASPDERTVRELYHLNDDFFGRVTGMSEDDVVQRHRICPHAFNVVMRERIEGYFVLLPLTGAAADSIVRGEIRAGRQLDAVHLTGDWESAAAMYISVVCAIGPRAQVMTVNALVDRIRTIHATHRNVMQAFIRAGTVAGLRALERYAKRKCAADATIERFMLDDAF